MVSKAHILDVLVEEAPVGLSVWDIDERLVFANARFAALFKIAPDVIHAGPTLEDVCQACVSHGEEGAPDAETLLGNMRRAMTRSRQQNGRQSFDFECAGRQFCIQLHFRKDIGWVVHHEDATADYADRTRLIAREEELEKQNMRFETAINSMSDGLSLFDTDHRLVMVNQRYSEIYGMPEALMQPGTHMRDILQYRLDNESLIIDDPATYVANGLELVNSRTVQTRTLYTPDGRTLLLFHRPIRDGSYLGIHRDITEHKAQIAAVEAREEALARQNLRFEAAVGNISHGLSMYDVDHRLVICNEKFIEIYGLPTDLTEPGTPFEKIIQHRQAHGMVSDGDGSLLSEYRKSDWVKTTRNNIVEFDDGRVIDILHHPMADGGWVSTHQDITAQRLSEKRIRHLARHDPLTGLLNRTEYADGVLAGEQAMANGQEMAILCLDLDRFKYVNDTYGHASGDAVLTEVAKRLSQTIRKADILARLGGDEFSIVIMSDTARADAEALARRIVAVLSTPFQVENRLIEIGASVGVSVGPEDGATGEILMRNADLALYQAKSSGRSTYCFFERALEAEMQRRRMLESGLKTVVENAQLTVLYQPLIDLKTNRISCVEALVRWDHPELGRISPAEFIPIAEETGAIIAIGRHVLEEACRVAADWPANVRIAVNLSPLQFKGHGLVELVADVLTRFNIKPCRLELEITESLILVDNDANLAVLHDLKKLGVRISMDDFGTGYSSLSYLRSFPFDKIKIDRSFLQSDALGVDNLAIIKAVVDLCKGFGMTTTTEGVETEEQLEAVRSRGCDEAQGFLFSPPLPLLAIKTLLAQQGENNNGQCPPDSSDLPRRLA